MTIESIIPHIEALVFATDKPLSEAEITEHLNTALGFIEERTNEEQVASAIQGIREKYASEFYAFEVVQSGGGWQFLTKPAYHKTVALLNGDKFIKKLSVAALETLAIIAYKQPVTKSEIELIRGVNCDYAVQKLLEKDLVIISGRNEDAVGKPLIYATSKSFMDYFGINSPEDLPKVNELLLQEIEKATAMRDAYEEEKFRHAEKGRAEDVHSIEEHEAPATDEEKEEILPDTEELNLPGLHEKKETGEEGGGEESEQGEDNVQG